MSEVRPLAERAGMIDLFDGNGSFVGKANVGVRVMLADGFYVPERTCSLVFVDEGEGHAPNVRCSACGGWLDAVADVEDVALFNHCPMCGARIERGAE